MLFEYFFIFLESANGDLYVNLAVPKRFGSSEIISECGQEPTVLFTFDKRCHDLGSQNFRSSELVIDSSFSFDDVENVIVKVRLHKNCGLKHVEQLF
jgi:hypothetical protein